MAIVIGLVVALILLLGFNLLGAGLRNPRWLFVGAVLIFASVVFAAINLPAVSVWTVLGQQMKRILTNPARLRAFNWTMAALLVGSLYPVLYPN